ncbi:ComEC/Rec2 family competence protein [Grimontia hollisae]|uniref:ComEC/Rec2 family competence protein n=1 Tax=Grimontia hollisae TaxID=673 RepID=UPI00165D43FA|nr:MBL fold metallo-hydrolase [Grimontia hollisae]
MANTFRIHMLRAKTGDSFIVECDKETFFIDGGTRSVAKYLKRYLQENDPAKLQAVFVTHVDRDHIGGIAKLYGQFSEYVPKTAPVYMNHPDQVAITTNTSGLVTYEDGNSLKDVLMKNGYVLDEATTGKILDFNGVTVEVLSPPSVVAGQLFTEWKASDDGLVSTDLIEVDCSNVPPEPKNNISSDIVNASSIALTIRHAGKTALFLSDSVPEVVLNQIEGKTKFDIVKISHHGSKHNTSMELLRRIDCNNFIISTNGPRSYGHPHAETLARLILSSIDHGYSECNITFNYEKVCSRIKINNLPNGFRVNLIYSETITL